MSSWLRSLGRKAKNAWGDYNLINGEKIYGKSTEDINKDYEKSVTKAQEAMDDVWGANRDILTGATQRADGTDRTLGSALDAYDTNARNITVGLAGEQDAAKRAQEFLNPMTDYINNQVTQNVQGSAGAALQSSGTQNAIAKGVADATANNWNSATQTALANSQGNRANLGAMQNINQQTLENDVMPQQDLMALNQDWGTQNLQTATAMAGQKASTEAADDGWLGTFGRLAGSVAPLATAS